MSTTLSSRWKLLIDVPLAATVLLPTLFNTDTGKSFIRSMGGRSTMDFSPKTLTCTTRFYSLLDSVCARLGFEGRKFPLKNTSSGISVNFRFRLYGPNLLIIEIERSPITISDADDLIDLTKIWDQPGIGELASNVIGLIASAERGFKPAAQRSKVFHCNYLVASDDDFPAFSRLVSLLTRHKTLQPRIAEEVQTRNFHIQSDASTLIVDRQGVVAAIPESLANDDTTIRRYAAAANMLEFIAAIERLSEKSGLNRLTMPENSDIDYYFSQPEQRFKFSTSSLYIWKALCIEFRLEPLQWTELKNRMSLEPPYTPTVLIVSAIEAEAAPSLARLEEPTTENRAGVFLNKGVFRSTSGEASVVVCSVGVGNTQAAINTSKLIDILKPSLVVLCGIAGGRKDTHIGDVVVGSHVYNFESGKDDTGGFFPRPRVAGLSDLSESLATAFLARERNSAKSYAVFFKPIACGEKVIATTKGASATTITSTYSDAHAVEMEGFGFLSVLSRQDSPAMLIRGISDLLDNKGETENHVLAVQNATDMTFRLIEFFISAKHVDTRTN